MFAFDEMGWFSLWVGAALKSMAIVGAAWLIAWSMRRRSAAARHLVWTAASAALLALPLLSIALPAMRVPVSALSASPAAYQVDGTVRGGIQTPELTQVSGALTVKQPRQATFDWRLALMLLWVAGAFASLARMAAGWIAVWHIRRKSKPIQDDNLTGLTALLGLEEKIALYEGPTKAMPMTIGFFRPAILLPAEATSWTTERRAMVLLHELAHVRRGDLATHQLARLALALYWWNPLAWIAWREFLKERERAADDLVLSSGERASDYAAVLLEVARGLRTPSLAASAALAMARPSQLEGRLLAILDSTLNRKPLGRRFALAATLAAFLAVAPLAALRAQEEKPQGVPSDIAAAIRTAASQKNSELLDEAAKSAVVLRQYDAARKLLDGSLEIRADVAGKQSSAYGIGLVKLGDLEHLRGNNAEAEEFYSQAVTVLGERPETARALVGLGIGALIDKHAGPALESFEKAQLADPEHSGSAKMWMAVVREQESNFTEAEALYRSALALGTESGAEQATTAALLGRMLHKLGREDEANALAAQSTALRTKLGVEAAAATRIASVSQAYKIGGDIKAPSLVSKVEPEYSEEARVAKYEGTAVLSVEVGTDGMAHNMAVVRGLGLGLDEKAMDAIAQWKFNPGTKGGQPVNVQATIEVNFRLL